ncbi:hypothetical protein ACP4OV_018043 [Aristida adscensionis]
MGHSSGEESEISDSDIAEYKEKICAKLRAGKMKVKHGESKFRCPFCPGKKKQDYVLKDLQQHATGIGVSPKHKAKVKATHQGLAMYLQSDLVSLRKTSLKLVISPKNEEKYVWPWMGVLVNVQTDLVEKELVREAEDMLRAQFSRFRPLQVTILGNSRDQLSCAIIKFSHEWSGMKDAFDFENHFNKECYGKADWNKRNCSKDDLYGWIARSEEYNSHGPIGEHLRKNGDLRSIADLERERTKETDRRVARYARELNEVNEKMREWSLKNRQSAMKLNRAMEDKDRLVEEHNQKILKMQEHASINYRKIVEENCRLHKRLQIQQVEIQQRSKQFEDLATKGNIGTYNPEAAKQKHAKDNNLFELANLRQEKADEELLELLEKQEKELKDCLDKQRALEEQLTFKQNLEVEIEQLRGKLEVMKHMETGEDTESKELNEVREKLKEKDKELEYIESIYQSLIVKERMSTSELNEAKKEVIKSLQEMSGPRSHIGVKRMGELDQKAFFAACKGKVAKHDLEGELACLCSKWEGELSQPEWRPLKVVEIDGQTKQIVLEDDEKLQALKAELGKEAHDVVVKALLELDEYNGSGRYPVNELWNFKDNKKASIGEATAYVVKQWRTRKKKHTYH